VRRCLDSLSTRKSRSHHVIQQYDEIDSGGDIHLGTDANFHQRHRASAGTGPAFHQPRLFISKEQVDVVGDRIEKVRKRPKKAYIKRVPDKAIDACEKSYEAADGNRAKADAGTFDDTGLMALVCRHDIPLFFANVDTPGEQQKYTVTLIKHIFSLLPDKATVTLYYDVACVLARSLDSASLVLTSQSYR
jgi:hypothetical protein